MELLHTLAHIRAATTAIRTMCKYCGRISRCDSNPHSQARLACRQLMLFFLLYLILCPEDGGDILRRNVGISLNHMAFAAVPKTPANR
jgi:hypothetical protein